MNYKRIDAVMSWAPVLNVENTCSDEVNALQKLDRLGRAQTRRVRHLQKHLERGDNVCDCYETLADIE